MPVESNAPSVPSDKDAILSAPRDDGANVLLTANRYDDPEHGRHGAIIEETSAFRSDIELFYDLHTLAWNADEEHTLDARDDAVESDVSYASSKIPEITLENRFDEPGSTGALTQRVVASVDTCGLLIETASVPVSGETPPSGMKKSAHTSAGIARIVLIVNRKMKLNGNGVTRSLPSTPNRNAPGIPISVPANAMETVTMAVWNSCSCRMNVQYRPISITGNPNTVVVGK